MKRFLRHVFLPHESNNHRSRLLHYEVLLVLLAFLVSVLFSFSTIERQFPEVLGDSTSISVTDLLTYTNLKRQENGLAPLKLNPQLARAADLKAHDMFSKDYWAHVSPDGTTPWVFIKDSGYEYLYAGENLARGFSTGSDVVDAWMKSPTHRENLLSPKYSDIGFAIMPGTLTGNNTVLVVQMFGSPYADGDDRFPTDEAISANNPPLNPEPSVVVTPTPASIASGVFGDSAPLAGVAAIQNQPILDTNTIKRNMSFFVLMLLIVVLALDAIIIERKKIARVFSHNSDHIMFLLFVLIASIIIGRGVII